MPDQCPCKDFERIQTEYRSLHDAFHMLDREAKEMVAKKDGELAKALSDKDKGFLERCHKCPRGRV